MLLNSLPALTARTRLAKFFLYHVFPGMFVSSELSSGLTVDTLQGGTVKVSVGNAGVKFNDAKAVEVDILTNNGVVYKIDTALDPADGVGKRRERMGSIATKRCCDFVSSECTN
jgi:uncharacterized surface protein with fasciclin (FAS1) repeats